MLVSQVVCLCVLAICTVYIHKLINVKVSFLHEEFSMLIPNAIFDSHSAGWQKTDGEVVFCRVRGVDGSCAKHLTVESYMDIYACTQLHLLLLVFHHPLFHSRLKSCFFCNPCHCSLSFSSSGLTARLPRLLRLLLA